MKKDYTDEVIKLRDDLDGCEIRDFHSIPEDAPLVAEMLNILANEKHMSTSRADAILTDAKVILPFISVI